MTRSIILGLLEAVVLLLTLNQKGLVSGCSNHNDMEVSISNISISSHHGDDPFHHHSLSEQRRLANTGGGRVFCGTESMSLPRQLQVFEEIEDYKRRNKRRLQSGGPYTIDVHFVHFKSNANEEDFPLTEINANLEGLNQHYASTPFTFRLLRVDEVVSATFATCAREDKDLQAQMGLAHREGDASLLNVFLCTVPDPVIRGFTNYPYIYPQALESDIIFIDPAVIGANEWTLSHETGHWMGLLHTFENGCSFPGDGVRDTPYQEEVVDTDIISCDQPTDTCPGWPGSDPIENIMGYVNKCYASFSEEQIELMQIVYEKYRLSYPGFCYMDLFITFNANPEDVKIHLASDSIYVKTIDGSEYAPNQSVVIPTELDNGKGSITVRDANSKGFPGGTIRVEVLENESNSSPRSIAADIKGDGSFQAGTTVEFMLPENCIAMQLTTGPKQTTTPAPVTAPAVDTPAPIAVPVSATSAPLTAPAADTPAPTQAPVTTTTEPPIAVPVSATSAPIPAPADTTQAPTQAPVTTTTEAPIAVPVSSTSVPTTAPAADTPAPVNSTTEETLSPTSSSPRSNISAPAPTEPPPSTPSHAYSPFQSLLLPSIGLAMLHVAVRFIA